MAKPNSFDFLPKGFWSRLELFGFAMSFFSHQQATNMLPTADHIS